jgi:hypothetical protein
MNTPEETPRPRTALMSPEAVIGLGITIAWLGLLCLMLGWAQVLRQVPASAWIWLPLGAVLVIAGGLGAIVGHSRKRS